MGIKHNMKKRTIDYITRNTLIIISDNLISIDEEITLETEFKNISIDSITFVKIIIELEKFFNIEFDDDMILLSEFKTVRSMVDYIFLKINPKIK